MKIIKILVIPFLVSIPILYPLKITENQSFLVFSGDIKWNIVQKKVKILKDIERS